MKNILFFILIILCSITACKSEQEKLKDNIIENTNVYLNSLSEDINLKVNDVRLVKIDSLSEKDEINMVIKIIHDEYKLAHDKAYEERQNLARENNLFQEAIILNIDNNGSYKYLVDRHGLSKNNTERSYYELKSKEDHLYSSYLELRSIETKANSKDVKSLKCHFNYKLKHRDGSIEPVDNLFFYNVNGEIYGDDIYFNNLSKTYLNNIQ